MAYDLTILSMAKSLASHAAARQGLIAENVANADTVGFRARDIESFAKSYRGPGAEAAPGAVAPPSAEPFFARATRTGHVGYDPTPAASPAPGRIYDISAVGADSPNGNTVSVEDQMARGAKSVVDHQMALGILRKSMDLLRAAVSKPR